jgi:hypothetical protein
MLKMMLREQQHIRKQKMHEISIEIKMREEQGMEIQ